MLGMVEVQKHFFVMLAVVFFRVDLRQKRAFSAESVLSNRPRDIWSCTMIYGPFAIPVPVLETRLGGCPL